MIYTMCVGEDNGVKSSKEKMSTRGGGDGSTISVVPVIPVILVILTTLSIVVIIVYSVISVLMVLDCFNSQLKNGKNFLLENCTVVRYLGRKGQAVP